MKYYNVIIRCICFSLFMLLTSCSTYRQSAYQKTDVNFRALSPRYVTIKQGQIEYYSFGRGSPIVMIPGYATDVTSWNRHLLAVLAQKHQVILLNNRNVAGSHIHSNSYRAEDLANDTYRLIKTLGLKKPAVVGISMGGMIAQQLAVLHQDSLGQLILINTSIAGSKAVHPDPKTEAKLVALPKNKLGFYAAAVELFFPPAWKPQMAYSLAADRFQPKYYTEIDAGAVMPQQRRLVMAWLNNDAAAIKIDKLHLPVLILNGEADVVIPPKNSVILANSIPHAKLVRWKDGGHAMIYQYPDEIGNAINNFIADHPQPNNGSSD